MNAIAKVGLMRAYAPIKTSTALTALMNTMESASRFGEKFERGFDDHYYAEQMPAGHVIEEAKTLLAECERRRAPAGRDAVVTWLKPLVAAVSNPPTEKDFIARAAVIAEVCADLPIAVFNVETQRDAIKRWKFWPSAAEVHFELEFAAFGYVGPIRRLRDVVSLRPMSEFSAAREAFIRRRDANERSWRVAPPGQSKCSNSL
jgi:hypothetical protein